MSGGGIPYTDQAREYMFSPSGADVILDTIELRHPAFLDENGNPMAIRFVNDPCALMATLEDDAPMNAGETVTFIATRFDLVIPDQPQSGLPQCQLAVSNVVKELSPWMTKATTIAAPLELSLRQYLADDLTQPCFAQHGLTFKNAKSDDIRTTGTASIADLLNFPAPRQCYTVVNSPGLQR